MATYPIEPIDASTVKPAQPAAIIVPRTGSVHVRHYYGNTARPDYNRLWITAPARHVQEVTPGDDVNVWPGDEVILTMEAGEELRLAINGQSGGDNSPGRTQPTWDNLSEHARVHEITDYPRDPVFWARYVEWEDLNLTSTNRHYNDSRTLVFYPASARRPTVGHVGFG